MNVLIVDDSPTIQAMLRFVLRNTADTKSALSGEEALQLLTQEDFDIILLDFNLDTGMNGDEVVKKIRSTGNDIHIIMMSSDPESNAAGIEAGANQGMKKDRNALVKAVQALEKRGDTIKIKAPNSRR